MWLLQHADVDKEAITTHLHVRFSWQRLTDSPEPTNSSQVREHLSTSYELEHHVQIRVILGASTAHASHITRSALHCTGSMSIPLYIFRTKEYKPIYTFVYCIKETFRIKHALKSNVVDNSTLTFAFRNKCHPV